MTFRSAEIAMLERIETDALAAMPMPNAAVTDVEMASVGHGAEHEHQNRVFLDEALEKILKLRHFAASFTVSYAANAVCTQPLYAVDVIVAPEIACTPESELSCPSYWP